MTDTPEQAPDQMALMLAIQQASEDGILVVGRSYAMVEHTGSRRRYVVETVNLGTLGRLELWAPPILAAAQLTDFKEAEYQARTGIVRGKALPDALAHLTDLGARLGGFGPNGTQ
jgi:hypothetical protein